MKYENVEIKYPKIMKIMQQSYANGILETYFRIEKHIQDKLGELVR